MLNDIIDAPTQSYAGLSVHIFLTGALGLITSFPAFSCYVCMLWITTGLLLAGGIQLIIVSGDEGKLFEWVDIALKEVFTKAADSVKGKQAVFLIENQFLCCGFGGQSDYENMSLSPGCCKESGTVCPISNAHSKVKNDNLCSN
ncbi:unnamed protein product [Rodentolepis nana]|uniref:Tetraspanin n=1 Tax=Rodentolepis nana TaxID=102285 RepID=A0A0R3U0Y4_RODNA|nr:unnamed protein product [Rodentolepis nana]